MPLFLIVSEIYGRKVSKWWKIRNFLKLFGPPCRNPLADLDGSAPECAQVCALHIVLHLASLREIEMVAVLCTNETTPMSFPFFLSPKGSLTPKKGEDTSRPRLRPHAKFGVNRPAACWEIVDRTNKQTYSKTNTSPFALTSEWRVIKFRAIWSLLTIYGMSYIGFSMNW